MRPKQAWDCHQYVPIRWPRGNTVSRETNDLHELRSVLYNNNLRLILRLLALAPYTSIR